MKKKEKQTFVERCRYLYEQFDGLEHMAFEGGRDAHAMDKYFYNLSDFYKLTPKDQDLDSNLLQVAQRLIGLGFSFGFSLGQMFDSTYPDDRDVIRKIQSVIKEKQLLPYVPRERKAA